MADLLAVQVAWALPHRQVVVDLEVPAGTTARWAALASGLDRDPSLEQGERPDLALAPLGIYGPGVPDDRLLKAGDRGEIYRPLLSDPREARREVAARGGTMRRGDRPGQG